MSETQKRENVPPVGGGTARPGQPASAGSAQPGKSATPPLTLPGSSEEQSATYEEMIKALTLDILSEARMKLMMAFRFLDTALWKMPTTVDVHPLSLATDGRTLIASPLYTLARFEQGINQVVRDYLHLLLHCVFRHPLDEDHINVSAWSLACDMVVEAIALEMTENRFICEDDDKRKAELRAVEKDVGTLSPAKLYRIFADAEINGQRARAAGFNAARLWDLRMLFQRDCHDFWVNVRHSREEDQKQDSDQAIRKRNLSDRLQDTPQDSRPQEQDQGEGNQENNQENNQDQGALQSQEDASDQGALQSQEDAADQSASQQQGGTLSADQQQASAAQQTGEKQSGQGEQQKQQGDEDARDDSGARDDDGDEAAGNDAADSNAAENADALNTSTPENEEELSDEERAALEEQLQQALAQQREEWEEIAKQIEMDLQSFSQGQGGGGQALVQNLAIANRRLANYHDFLRQFATMGEDMKINDDEFDYIYYTYGMNTYGNMPLVEPLEYKESYRVREFVIALDTSGSCSGALIRSFVTRTYDILRESEGFGDKVNIHIIQCDNKIQTDLKIENVEDLEKYCREFQAYGFGGTDFRPVFEYVEELCDKGEFENLRGLIYFTDGLGTFPQVAPQYETAFVFIDDGGRTITVPPWAMKVVMDEEEIYGL